MLRSPVQSSLALQLLLWVNRFFSVLFFLVIASVYVFKVYTLPYSKYVAITDGWLIALFVPIETCRIAWAERGNKTETPGFLSFSLLLSFAVIALCVYLAAFQSYVLLMEFVFICIEGGLVILASIISLAAIATFSRTHAT